VSAASMRKGTHLVVSVGSVRDFVPDAFRGA
jgi:hypothetical protein